MSKTVKSFAQQALFEAFENAQAGKRIRPESHGERVARRKAGDIPGWEVYRWEVIGDPFTSKDVMYTGCVPRLLKRGPRAGHKAWDSAETRRVVVVAGTEVETEFRRYEQETGNCGECMGEGQRCRGWNKAEGIQLAPCERCASTGRCRK